MSQVPGQPLPTGASSPRSRALGCLGCRPSRGCRESCVWGQDCYLGQAVLCPLPQAFLAATAAQTTPGGGTVSSPFHFGSSYLCRTQGLLLDSEHPVKPESQKSPSVWHINWARACLALLRFQMLRFHKLKVRGSPASSKPVSAVLLTAFAHVVSPCHVLVIRTFKASPYCVCYGDL